MLWFVTHQHATSSEDQMLQSHCEFVGCLPDRVVHERILMSISVQSEGSW
jgi:hypothetical protein